MGKIRILLKIIKFIPFVIKVGPRLIKYIRIGLISLKHLFSNIKINKKIKKKNKNK